MKLQNRIGLLFWLGTYLKENGEQLREAKARAEQQNAWFTTEFIDMALANIVDNFLDREKLENWAGHYHLDDKIGGKNVGIVMAGNIPLVGFHDFLAVFISGHSQTVKLSAKDDVLLKHLVQKMYEQEVTMQNFVSFAPMLKGCDAYIATGSNNSAVYFDYYFSKYPSIIRRNRTSVAVLNGNETPGELEKLSADIHLYFGLGCRNVTKIFVPEDYNFVPLIKQFEHYAYFGEHHKYKNNYDYNLSLHLLNNKFYMSGGSTLLVENESVFSPISQLNYGIYNDRQRLLDSLKGNDEIQCIAGVDIPFGQAQCPGLMDYADGVDTIQFLLTL